MNSDAIEAPHVSAAGKPRRTWIYWVAGLVLALIAWNAIVFVPVSRALSDEDDASMFAYRRWLVSPSQIVVDVWSVEGSQSMAGMDRMLFKAAEGLQDRSYNTVALAYRGETKLLIDGSYFQEIGATREIQNPVYTMRTMQEHLYNPDGSPAFGVWTGGWLGVLGKQLEDHNEFHKRWWVNDALGIPSDGGAA
jgi:hypothetical protein